MNEQLRKQMDVLIAQRKFELDGICEEINEAESFFKLFDEKISFNFDTSKIVFFKKRLCQEIILECDDGSEIIEKKPIIELPIKQRVKAHKTLIKFLEKFVTLKSGDNP